MLVETETAAAERARRGVSYMSRGISGAASLELDLSWRRGLVRWLQKMVLRW